LESDAGAVLAAFQDGLRPPPDLTVDAWADQFRNLPRISSGEPGRWRTGRTPYLREILQELSPRSHAEKVVLMKGSQIGATEAGINWLLSIIDNAPAPTLAVQPTIDLSKRFSKQRISPSILECRPIRNKVKDNKSRGSSNTILQKDYPGGTLIITGANSAVGLRSMPVCNLFADEIDGWPADVDGEGDPLDLARRRKTNFARRKEFDCSTPTIAGMSRIEREFNLSDQRYYNVPCPFCEGLQKITWDKLKFDNHDPKTVRMICEFCHAEIREYHKTEMLNKGKWIAENPESETPGFHLSALYSPLGWYSWRQAVEDHLAALGDPLKRKVWVNTVLGELWDESITTVDHNWLIERCEQYPAQVPAEAVVLTCGADTQDDRIEATIIGTGKDNETWLIDHRVLMGDPDQPQVWQDLTALLNSEFEHERGFKINIGCTCIDAMGHHTDEVYKYCKENFNRRVFAIQGARGPGRPLVINYTLNKRAGVYLFHLGVDQGKETLYNRLKIKDPGPGFCHFPEKDHINEGYFKQLTAEKRLLKNNAGIPRLTWILPKGKRNEALDCYVYALAALNILNPNINLLIEQNKVYRYDAAPPKVRRFKRVLSQGVR